MRAVLQRVSEARVRVGGEVVGEVAAGWCVLLGVAATDTLDVATKMAEKVALLRAFDDAGGRPNLTVHEVPYAAILLVSNFTLCGDCSRGRRPSWHLAAKSADAEPLYLAVAQALRARGLRVELGRFGADMRVELVNDGPVTLVLDVDG